MDIYNTENTSIPTELQHLESHLVKYRDQEKRGNRASLEQCVILAEIMNSIEGNRKSKERKYSVHALTEYLGIGRNVFNKYVEVGRYLMTINDPDSDIWKRSKKAIYEMLHPPKPKTPKTQKASEISKESEVSLKDQQIADLQEQLTIKIAKYEARIEKIKSVAEKENQKLRERVRFLEAMVKTQVTERSERSEKPYIHHGYNNGYSFRDRDGEINF
mgnify:FL=1